MTRYTPADPLAWVVLVVDRRVLAVEPSLAEHASVLEARLASDGGFADALEEVVRDGILTAPGFALLDWSTGTLRAVLRGATRLTVRGADGESTASGSGVATWTEQVIEGPRSVRLEIPGGIVDAAGTAVGTDASGREAPIAQELSVAPDSEVTIVSSEIHPDPTATVPALTASGPDEDDPSFGITVVRRVAGAAVRLPSSDADRLGDHDGETVLASEIARPADRPPTFSLVSATGTVEPLDRGVIIGRAPSVSQASVRPAGGIPRLITIDDDPDISRNHLRVVIEGDAPVVTDLGSKNGTSIVQPGKPPQRLRGNEPTIVVPGTVIDLGAGIGFTIRQDPGGQGTG